MRDRAPVNSKALRTVSILYPNMMDIGCISHSLDRVSTKCVTPVVTSFMLSWNAMFTTRMRARQAFKTSEDEGCQDTTPLHGGAFGNVSKWCFRNGGMSLYSWEVMKNFQMLHDGS